MSEFLDQFSIHQDGIEIINLDRNSHLSKRQTGELVGEIFAYFGWSIMDDYTFDCLKDIIKNILDENEYQNSDGLARKIIEGLKY